ncbi:MAG: dihydropteroate synthase [Proteobacteria bacterium]|nr:dihydropteroate synthase [Pseudomonadota bacterium]MDA0993587.1 dihydropteroate synthase [Pseudomonadota bacterium]
MLKLGKHALNLDRPKVMGILNVTPDSFSDGGKFATTAAALEQAELMVDAGADVIDVGGESTRPGSNETSLQEELDRVMPVIQGIINRFDIPISIDTSKPEVMRSAVDAGASMINDIFALRREGAIEAAVAAAVPVCLMHMLGLPRSMQSAPEYAALPQEIIDFLAKRVDACVTAGLGRDLLVVDPGFGFGKNDGHNLEILAKLDQFAALGLPLLVGLSRKRTLGNLTGRPADQRVAAGVAAAVVAAENGANIIRTHDVAETVDAFKVIGALRQYG